MSTTPREPEPEDFITGLLYGNISNNFFVNKLLFPDKSNLLGVIGEAINQTSVMRFINNLKGTYEDIKSSNNYDILRKLVINPPIEHTILLPNISSSTEDYKTIWTTVRERIMSDGLNDTGINNLYELLYYIHYFLELQPNHLKLLLDSFTNYINLIIKQQTKSQTIVLSDVTLTSTVTNNIDLVTKDNIIMGNTDRNNIKNELIRLIRIDIEIKHTINKLKKNLDEAMKKNKNFKVKDKSDVYNELDDLKLNLAVLQVIILIKSIKKIKIDIVNNRPEINILPFLRASNKKMETLVNMYSNNISENVDNNKYYMKNKYLKYKQKYIDLKKLSNISTYKI